MNSLIKKIASLAFICIALLIALAFIRGKVLERQSENSTVKHEISQTHSGAQTIAPPVLVVTQKIATQENQYDKKTKKNIKVTVWENQVRTIIPQNANIASELTVTNKKRGIYSAPVYKSLTKLSGNYAIPDLTENKNRKIVDAYLIMGINHMKGLSDIPEISFNNQKIRFNLASTNFHHAENLLTIRLKNLQQLSNKSIDFSLDLNLKGSLSFGLLPIAESTNFSVKSNWQHPSFFGELLPDAKTINAEGFSANWKANKLSAVKAINCVKKSYYCTNVLGLSVRFLQTVDGYTKTDRITKYGFLFILLSFAAFLLFEVLKKLPIHGIAYGLVGCALMIFFLLLLSLSEHIGFSKAYIASSIACILLISFYLTAVLKSFKLSSVFSIGLAAVYVFFYYTLQSEDYALLMGTLLLFAILSGIMVMTRKVDWSEYSNSLQHTLKKKQEEKAEL